MLSALKWARSLLPVGKFGIRKISQTSFYHNFGPAAVGVVGLIAFGGIKFAYL